MRNSKLGRVLGLSIVAALSMMAFTAVSAQAGIFLVNGKPASELLAKIVGEQEGSGILLVPGRNLKLECHNGAILNDSAIENSTDALAKVAFTNCLPFSHTKGTALPCTVHVGEAITLVLPVLHPAGTPHLLFEPDPPSTTFTTVLFLGETCPLPEVNPVTGSVVARVDKNNTIEPLLLFNETIQLLLGDKLSFGGSSAYIFANAVVRGSGNHLNATLAID